MPDIRNGLDELIAKQKKHTYYYMDGRVPVPCKPLDRGAMLIEEERFKEMVGFYNELEAGIRPPNYLHAIRNPDNSIYFINRETPRSFRIDENFALRYEKVVPTPMEVEFVPANDQKRNKKVTIDSKGRKVLAKIEEEESINKKEEVIVNMNELADFYARIELTTIIPCFAIDTHLEEYNKCHKKHIRNILRFKKNNNG